jgi:DNA-binding NarL/FixJ family response regulator
MNKCAIVYVNNRYTLEQFYAWAEMCKTNIPDTQYRMIPNIETMFSELSNPFLKVNFINVDVETLKNNISDCYAIISTLKVLANSTQYRDCDGKTKKRDVKIIGVVGYDTPPNFVKEIQSLVDGLCIRVGGPWTKEMVLENQKKLSINDLTVPKLIRDLLRKVKSKRTETIKLTPRQQQVFSLVTKRGASNKIIAKTLNITESTVKLHIGAILKKYGLRSRTQLAIFAKNE